MAILFLVILLDETIFALGRLPNIKEYQMFASAVHRGK